MSINCDPVEVAVIYGQRLVDMLEPLGVNGDVSRALSQKPIWEVLPIRRLSSRPDLPTSRVVTFFSNEEFGNVHAVLPRMSRRCLRPVSAHEFLALIQPQLFLDKLPEKMVCLGTFWGSEPGQEKVLFWRDGCMRLVPIYITWGATDCFPAVSYSGSISSLPGMPGYRLL